MGTHSRTPTQRQLLLPLLEALDERGGAARPVDIYDAVADRVGVSTEARTATAEKRGGGRFSVFQRAVRFARQKAVAEGLVDGRTRNLWQLTETARRSLRNVRPGFVFVIFETERGVALWGEMASAVSLIDDATVRLIVTSPPYPLEFQKQYGGLRGADYVDWLVEAAALWHEKLTEDGSLWLNLGSAWTKGEPTMSLYQERVLLKLIDEVGFHLAERFYYVNPAKLPAPAEWVTIRRIRVTDAVEHVYWLGKTAQPKASNLRCLRPYSAAMRRKLATGGERAARRPSGYVLDDGAFGRDNGGSIPNNLILAANTASNDGYLRACRERGLEIHPARFNEVVPDLAIRMCTEAGDDDLVWDPYGGSGTTASVAERLGRRWVTSEKSLTYLRGAATRFEGSAGYRAYFDDFAE